MSKVLNTVKAQRQREKRAWQREQHEIYVEVRARANGLCESCGQLPDFRGLSISHTEMKKMGGSKRVYQAEELQALCVPCHSKRHRLREAI